MITINVEDEKKYIDISLVVDQPGYFKRIVEAREHLKLTPPLENWTQRQFEQKNASLRRKLKSEINKIRIELHLPHTFLGVIKASILLGTVSENDYSPAKLVINETTDRAGEYVDQQVSILISPFSREEDILKELTTYRHQILAAHQEMDYVPLYTLPLDTATHKSKFRLHKKWHSLHYGSGQLTIEEITQAEVDRCPFQPAKHSRKELSGDDKEKCTCFDISTIERGIANYVKLLHKSSTF